MQDVFGVGVSAESIHFLLGLRATDPIYWCSAGAMPELGNWGMVCNCYPV